MSRSARHLEDDRLLDCYLSAQAGEAVDPRVAEHLTDCGDCRARYRDLTSLLDGLRDDADAEIDTIFTPERLQAQQAQIARRLEHVGRSARVIHFPGHAAGPSMPARAHSATRWLAATAAALFVGVGLGVFYQSTERTPVSTHAMRTVTAPSPAAVLRDSAADDAFFEEMEAAADRPHTRELAAFDALTPHVREVSNTLK